jgi:radical SAM superfamily enzyme YgiQ (UPF0313 family)
MRKILLNWLPPASIDSPSPALSILKSFLEVNHFKVEIKYWNILFHDLMTKYIDSNFEFISLIPFLSVLGHNYSDEVVKSRLTLFLQKEKPHFKITGKEHFNDYLLKLSNDVLFKIKNEIQNIRNEYMLFGFSSKFYQWIPAQIVADFLKNCFPATKLVIGGFTNRYEAFAFMKLHSIFDFAIWGEGEYPLLDLCNNLANGLTDFKNIPGLIYREDNKLNITDNNGKKYLDFNNSINPDFSDYFEQIPAISSKVEIAIPLESSRSCHWQKCKFCFLNEGYRYRKKLPERLIGEIQDIFGKYLISKFIFLDNDFIGKSLGNFEILLDKLIVYKAHTDPNFEIIMAEIIPKNLNSGIIRKMAKAGIRFVQAGYESTSDSLLAKMNKKSSFSDNILFVKWAIKYGIAIGGTNIIIDLIDETEQDILESIENLHYLRFYLWTKKMSHDTTPLSISNTSRYFNAISPEELVHWNLNAITPLLPAKYLENISRFHLFDYTRNFHNKLWESFRQINKHYAEKNYQYRLLRNNEIVHYEEYFNNEIINSFSFTEPVYWEILQLANFEVISKDSLSRNLANLGFIINQKELSGAIGNLRNNYLLYSNLDESEIVSIIDTETVV